MDPPKLPSELADDEVDSLLGLRPETASAGLDCTEAPDSRPQLVSQALASEPQVALVASSAPARQLGRQHSLATSAASSFMDALSDAEPSSPTLELGPSMEELPKAEQAPPPQVAEHQPHEAQSSRCILRPAHVSYLGANSC